MGIFQNEILMEENNTPLSPVPDVDNQVATSPPIVPTPPPPEPIQPTKKTSLRWLGILSVVVLAVAIILVAFKLILKNKTTTPLEPTPSATPIVTAKCVEKSSLNCEEEVELSFECTEEYQNWARANCPGWEEKIDCTDPRPEVCTMECIQNPPYICGSDGKSYCTVCQACSNKNVAWYEMKASACEE